MAVKVYAPDNYYYYGTKFLILVILIWKTCASLSGVPRVSLLILFILMMIAMPVGAKRQTLVFDDDSVEGSFGKQRNRLPLKNINVVKKRLLIKRWTMLNDGHKRIFIPHELFKVKTLNEILDRFTRS